MAAGYDVPKQIFVHGYLLLDDRKISKSLGNVVDPLDLIDVYGADAVRYWCARAVSFGQDGSASIDGIHERYERELGNDLGNLLSRTTAMIARYRDGRIGARAGRNDELAAADRRRSRRRSAADLDRFDITAAIDRIWMLVRWLNRYVDRARAVGARQGRGASRRARRGPLRPRRRAARASRSRSRPTCPKTAPRILEALGQPPDLAWERRRIRPARAGRRDRGRAAALPAHRDARRGRRVIDTHAHLDPRGGAGASSRGRARPASTA